ncbi:MAG: thioredoxin family protein [Rhodospirillaceae bacterium]|nr:thioredoxin family protein [Rhodospirillaceae bacterium]
MVTGYEKSEPARAEVDAMPGATLIEFGTPWCGHCMAAQPLLAAAMAGRKGVRHLKIEDGRGRRLGRTFTVKLWPTLVLLRDGAEVGRLVRPESEQEIARLLDLVG